MAEYPAFNRSTRVRFSPALPKIICPGDVIGSRVCLRSKILGVRVSSGAPKIGLIVIMGAHGLCKPEVGVRSSVGPPNFKARSYNGYYRGLSIRRWEFDSPTSRQVFCRYSSEEEHSLDKRKADISKLSIGTKYFGVNGTMVF